MMCFKQFCLKYHVEHFSAYFVGHEFAFVAFLFCLFKIGACDENDLTAVGCRVFPKCVPFVVALSLSSSSLAVALTAAFFFFLGACLRRRSRCHEFPPSRSALSASLRSHQSKIHRSQVGLHGSEPGLPWTTNPPSPVVRWACNAGLESSVMILSGVGSVEMSNEGQTTAADSV